MFVVQNYFKQRKAKIQAYEEACEKWLNEYHGDYGYRTKREYERDHPYPVADLGFVARVIVAVLGILVVLSLLATTIYHQVTKPEEPKKKTEIVKVTNDGEKCGKFKKGDHVIVQYGDYATLQGNLIGGCSGEEDYQVKLDPTQMADVTGDGQDKVDVSNKIIAINSDSNIVVINSEKK